ncbi:MAG: isocitrate/isopropylmalate family dehydrogenase [candidate division WOR-3 bacterium]
MHTDIVVASTRANVDTLNKLIFSIGMLPSASIGKNTGLFEPVHGSAPGIAGRNIANPCGIILSLALLFRYSLNETHIAKAIENAVSNVLEKGYRTKDLAEKGSKILSTSAMGDYINNELKKILTNRS